MSFSIVQCCFFVELSGSVNQLVHILSRSDLNRVNHAVNENQSFDLCDGKRDQQHHLLYQHHCLLLRQRAVIVQIQPADGDTQYSP